MTLRRATLALALVTAVLSTASTALAGNDDEILNGPQAAMTGGAVTAITSDGSALLYNPAGLALSNFSQVNASASAFIFRIYKIPKLILDTSGKSGGSSFFELVSAPAAVAYVSPITPDISLGLGAFVTEVRNYTATATLNTNVGGGQESEWLLTMAGTVNLYNFGGGLGFRLSPNMRIGVSVLGIYAGLLTSNQFAGGSHDPDTLASSNFRTFGNRGMGDYFGFRGAVGWQWDPNQDWSVGVSVMSPSFMFASHETLAQVASENSFQMDGMGNQGQVMAVDSSNRTLDSSGVTLLTPTRFRGGVAYHYGQSVVSLDADFQHGTEDRSAVPNVRLGGRFQVGKDTWLGAGAFTDLSSTHDLKELADSDVDFFGGVIGMEWNNSRKLAEDEDATSLAFSTTINLRYAYGTGQVVGLATDGGDLQSGPGLHRTSMTVHEFGLYLGAGLYY